MSNRIPEYTCNRFKVIRRNFSKITTQDVEKFKLILDDSRVINSSDQTAPYNIDFFKIVRGQSCLVLKPKTANEISEILSYCNERNLAICPQSGNTGTVGGAVPVFDEIILSMQLMDSIEKIDPVSGILICQAGCVLENLEKAAREVGLIVPLDLGAKSMCLIGGNISTNAGGLRMVKYGSLHGSVLGVEVVKVNGEIVDLMSNFKKDNTGYHLKHLFIGSEGTLGVITKIAMHLPAAPKSTAVAFIGASSYDNVIKTFAVAKKELAEILSSFEMIDRDALDVSITQFGLKSPIGEHPFYALLEISGSRIEHDREKLNLFLKNVKINQIALDGVVVTDPGKIRVRLMLS